ncbi:phosphoserine phosphatase SerB [Propionibacteriaceae bacterium Y2011]|uniref:phosphoserine phosphatase SerB n=1 Tax=Microlunatus sp. Y2014 TaxID=3418488 RepID=UPI003B4F4965
MTDRDATSSPDSTDSRLPEGRLLLLTDVDSTLIRNEVIDLLADEAGCGTEVADVTARAMAGELDFEQSLRARVRLLAGLDVAALGRADARVTYTSGAAELMSALRAAGHATAIVSGGFTHFTDRFRRELGIDHAYANELEIVDGRLTGQVVGEVVGPGTKARLVRELAAAEGVPMSRTVAVGDGANDSEMVAAAALGVAFCAKPALRAVADVVIDEPDLRHVLPLLGL